MSVNTKTNVLAQDNPELKKFLNELTEDIKNNPYFQSFARVMDSLHNFKEQAVNVLNEFDGNSRIEYVYNESFTNSEDKFTKVIAEKLDDYTFRALLINEPVECKIMFIFNDKSFVFNWDNDIKHFVCEGDGDGNYEHVYDEVNSEFIPKDEYLKSLKEDRTDVNVEENKCDSVFEDGPEIEDAEYTEEEVYEDTCTPIDNAPCAEKCDTSFADHLYDKLNNKFQDDIFNKYKEDLIVAFHRIFDYEMYEPGFNDNHSEIDKVKFTLEDVLKVCPSANVGKFWDKISSQKIVGLIADEFKFRTVNTYLDQKNNTHCVVCILK